MASQSSPSAAEHLQNDNSQSLKNSDYQPQDSGPKLQNGGQIMPPSIAEQQGRTIKSPPSNGSGGGGIGPQNEIIPGQGYHHDPNLGPPPSSQPGQPHMQHHPGLGGEKEDLSQQPPHLQHQHLYGHQPMHGHPMHGPPQQHIPGQHIAMHPHQQRYHPHQAGPHGPPHGMQHPMHPHDPNQQQIDPYGHYRGMMPTRPPQRYNLPPQGPQGQVPPPNAQNVPTSAQQQPQQPGAQQGPTPTLNSLLQSQPSQQGAPQQHQGTPHRYPNTNPYDPYGVPPVSGPPPIAAPNSGSSSPMTTHSQSQQQQQQQQNWAPPPRPYSPQQYRGPPPVSFSF
jgi:hypothetical protein